MKFFAIAIATSIVAAHLSASAQDQNTAAKAKSAAERLNTMTAAEKIKLNKTPIKAGVYPAPEAPHYGPAYGSIVFVDTDMKDTIGGTLTMKPAVDAKGNRVNEADEGITTYMVHWGLEVGAPGVADDKGNGDLGGDCMGFRDTGHVVAMPASEVGNVMQWEIPQGTVVPEGAVYFVGHTLYGKIHNLGKCTQTQINNIIR
ncbi:hypothetical protein [Kordiimonas aquimaris]|uniref:hypothetical protein n=1 Tax=Kordiimonas aquimaris TaxID=707591 RepID=UPI0021D25664|nr:hypothetical protein [Kordiimonas aquimaris]